MKRVFIVIPILFISLLNFAQSGTRFMDNRPWKEVLQRAKRENKMIFVDCYTSWCDPCKLLATQVFPQEKVGKIIVQAPYSKEFRFAVEHLNELEARGLINRYGLEARLSEELGFADRDIFPSDILKYLVQHLRFENKLEAGKFQ